MSPTKPAQWTPPVTRVWRNLFHATNGILVLILLTVAGREITLTVTALLFVAAAGLDIARFRSVAVNRLFFGVFAKVVSERELNAISSSTWYLGGVLGTVALFPTGIAARAVLTLAISDPLASLVGGEWGRTRFGSGTRIGSVTFMLTTLAITLPDFGFVRGLVTAAFAAFAEAQIRIVDDNLIVPLAVGTALWVLTPV